MASAEISLSTPPPRHESASGTGQITVVSPNSRRSNLEPARLSLAATCHSTDLPLPTDTDLKPAPDHGESNTAHGPGGQNPPAALLLLYPRMKQGGLSPLAAPEVEGEHDVHMCHHGAVSVLNQHTT